MLRRQIEQAVNISLLSDWGGMATSAALIQLEILHRRNAKRTRDIFASEPGDTVQEDEPQGSSFAAFGFALP